MAQVTYELEKRDKWIEALKKENEALKVIFQFVCLE